MLLYTTDIINEVSAAAVGQVMAETLRDDLVLHPAWELVEEFTATDQQWYVFKCLATESGLLADYYMVLNRRISTGELRFTIGEGYDATTNTLSYLPTTLSGSQIPFDAQGRTGTTQVLGTSQLSNAVYAQWTPSGTSTKYWTIVSEEGFTTAFNGAANGFVHVSSYEPLSQFPAALPIQIIGSSSAQGGMTRNLSVGGTTTYDVALSISAGGSTNLTGVALGFQGRLDRADKMQNGQMPLAEQGILIYNWLSQGEPVIGWAVGKQKRMRVGQSGTAPSSFVWGDAYVLDGTLWVPYLPTDVRIWDTGVAA